jgi:NAD(P)-dependent dehydrogenase (short-subunit alcohol dehydrogenase family)
MIDYELHGKTAIVTGGSDGLGRAAAKKLAQEGANVVICARREKHLMNAAKSISEETSGSVIGIQADVTSKADCSMLINETIHHFGPIDILVNNAGSSLSKGIEDLDDEQWYNDIELKVMAAVRMSKGVIPYMKNQGSGCIVNATTGAGKVPEYSRLPTSVSRAAGLNLTKSLANEFAKDKIRINAVCIGKIKSAQWERRSKGGDIKKLYSDLGKTIPLGRVGEAEEYADLVAFLCSARASYITGAAINLDGGLCPSI